jgi:homoserine kinase
MTTVSARPPGSLRLKLPATSANLGPGFDAVAVALDFHLEIAAQPATEFSIAATGRDAARCASVENNLILDIYRSLLAENGKPVLPLALRMVNGIPLGMGCGSSAAGRLAGISLAVHFGKLGWSSDRILETASSLEGHPDNAAACWLGGFVAAVREGEAVRVARVDVPSAWRAVIVLPLTPLATSRARAMLPDSYSRSDVVANIQAASLLGIAFAQSRGDLLRAAMSDRIHQPYRAPVCPLLGPLLPLAGSHGILGVALSGAGPGVLVIVDEESNLLGASAAIHRALGSLEAPELLVSRFECVGGSRFSFSG